MTLRAKLALALAMLAGLSVVAVGWFSYDATSDRMLAEIDESLRNAARIERPNEAPPDDAPTGPGGYPGIGRLPGLETSVVQVLDDNGERIAGLGSDTVQLPVDDAEREIAVTGRGDNLRTATGSDGREYRVLTRPLRAVTVQIGRDLTEMDNVLRSLRRRIIVIGAVAVAIAAAAGWLFARGLTKRLRQLTDAAGEVSTTGRLDVDVERRVAGGGNDEVARLGAAMSTMLGALSRSQDEQRRLVLDAGHELRTPLTSLRTNVDVLRRHGDLPAEMRSRVLDDLDVEVAELSSLVEEVVAVGSGRTSDEPFRTLAVREVVDAAADRVQRRSGRPVARVVDDTMVVAQRALLERAITNLIDNAAKFDQGDRPIEVDARDGRVSVRDHGPGIAAEDLGRVFARFYRSIDSRSLPGSGLGLSIVAEIAAAHGGSTFAHNHPEGGAVVGFVVPRAGSPEARRESAP